MKRLIVWGLLVWVVWTCVGCSEKVTSVINCPIDHMHRVEHVVPARNAMYADPWTGERVAFVIEATVEGRWVCLVETPAVERP